MQIAVCCCPPDLPLCAAYGSKDESSGWQQARSAFLRITKRLLFHAVQLHTSLVARGVVTRSMVHPAQLLALLICALQHGLIQSHITVLYQHADK